ncbi:hypothetical protein JAAARDRAFT_28565 [Jaapia argillacea MUCL 33604]|uniref:Cytochrome P450 n=1 Tax=Jaapia argillacea MUCL 33604 TaxID=933084 RepID=A0A067QD69_9AGAM|nr:hypothetical protein JAAARDRAFT_28565 [Jaapia argillacea MUCL 33604]
MPTTEQWKTVAKWGHEYGDLTYLRILNQSLLFINSPSLANELLDKKSAIYSGRPFLPMASGLVGWDNSIVFASYGTERFLEQRKLFQGYMGTKASVKKLWDMQEDKTVIFLKRLLDGPDQYADHIRWTAGAIILHATYGYQVQQENDPLIRTAEKCLEDFSATVTPGAFLVDVLPFLRYVPTWFPGAGFRRIALGMRETLKKMGDVPLHIVKKQLESGTAIPSFTTSILSGPPLTDTEADNLKWAAASMYAGGSDTSVSVIHAFFLAMTLYPNAQALAQSELDAVVGSDRLPSFSDREQLPYVEALLKEVLRWSVAVPLGAHHMLTQDDVHDGYFIPKGTIAFANIWWFLHNPDTYTNPMEFNPDRFLGENPPPDPREYVFGFGRRICAGMHFVDASIFISLAMTLAVFKISKAIDPVTGESITPAVEFTSSSVYHPAPFQCSIKVRSGKAEGLIRDLH